MNITYKCRCMDAEATVAVADRRDDQDVVDWVSNTAGHAIADDHHTRSPLCQSREMEYAKFEVDPEGNTPVGRLPRQ